jgi:hypothetical protein
MRSIGLSLSTLGAALASVSSASAQPTVTSAVRAELRIVAQDGLPTDAAGIVDHLGAGSSVGTPTAGPNQTRRFEVQYRLVDLDLNDDFVPAGLNAGVLTIRAGTNPALGRLDRAVLSRFEANLAAAAAPTSPDMSGPQTVAAALQLRGLHRPFRGGIPGPSPNNENPANGTIENNSLTLRGATALCLSQNDQNAAGGPDGLGAWYGLYSFNFISGLGLGTVDFTAEFVPDATTGNRYGFFTDANPVPVTSPNALIGTASLVVAIPGPGAATLLGLGCLWGSRRRR